MFDFEALGQSRKPCSQCGEVFRGREETTLCLDCQYKQEHPEMQDEYWTWTRISANRWGIVAYWPDQEPPPEPGELVLIHRKDGTSSNETITEVEGLRYGMDGRGRLYCRVRN